MLQLLPRATRAILLPVLGALCAAEGVVQAQATSIDINRAPGLTDFDSRPGGFLTVGNVVYFAAETVQHGRELWRADQTGVGAQLVGDLWPGVQGSEPVNLTLVGSRVFFAATRAAEGEELWTLDANGQPRLAADLLPGSASSEPGKLTVVGTDLWFAAATRPGDRELVRFDTLTDTWVTFDIRTGLSGSNPVHITPYRRGVVCSADDDVSGRELWYATGSNASLLADVAPGARDSSPSAIAVAGSTVYFSASSLLTGRELWRKNLLGPVELVADLRPGVASSFVGGTFVHQGATLSVYFLAGDGGGSTRLMEYRPGQSPELRTLPYSIPNRVATSMEVVQIGSPTQSIYACRAYPQGGEELIFVTPGQVGVTVQGPFTEILGLCGVGDRAYFYERNDDGEETLFSYSAADPSRTQVTTGGGTFEMSGLAVGPGYVIAGATGTAYSGIEPCRIPFGVDQPLTLVDDLNAGRGNRGSLPQQLTPLTEEGGLGDSVLFTAETGRLVGARQQPQVALFVSDGTDVGTVELFAGDGLVSPDPVDFTFLGGTAYFTAETVQSGRELYSTRGTLGSTQLAVDVFPGSGSSDPRHLTAFDGRLFFSPGGSDELWVTDGTAAGTGLVQVITPGRAIAGLHAFDDQLLVLVAWTGYGFLWSTGGQPGQAVQLARVGHNTGMEFSARLGDRVVLSAEGKRPLVTDGTAGGTYELPGLVGASRQAGMVVQGGSLWYVGWTVSDGHEPWVSDLTQGGSRRLADIAPGADSSMGPDTAFAVTADAVFFVADDQGAFGRELWRAVRPSQLGLSRVTDQSPGPGDWIEPGVGQLGTSDRVMISAGIDSQGNRNRELWLSDGTLRGTVPFQELRPGSSGADATGFVPVGNRLFFVADDGLTGRELWSMPLAAAAAPNVVRYGTGCGAPGQPRPEILIEGNPNLGETFQLGVPVAQPGQAVFALLGIARVDLPLPGGDCSLLTSSDVMLVGSGTGAVSDVPVAVPSDRSLLGASMFGQMARVVPGGPALGVVDLSDAMRLVIGGR